MSFANPWGLLGLFAIPTILVIHLFHRKYPPMQIAGLHLWSVDSYVKVAGRKRDRLPITQTLLLELLAALLITLLISQPRFGNIGRVSHWVVILDNSASMSAVPPGEESLRDQALAQLRDRVREEGTQNRFTVILTGRRPVMLAGPTVSWPQAQQSLENWKPHLPHHGFRSAWESVSQFGTDAGKVLFLTDRMPEKSVVIPQNMEIISVGQPMSNLAFTSARWSHPHGQTEGSIYYRLENFSKSTMKGNITGKQSDGSEFYQHAIDIPAGKAYVAEFSIPEGIGQLELKCTAVGDGLEADNNVTLLEPHPRTVKVGLSLGENVHETNLVKKVLQAVDDIEVTSDSSPHLLIGLAEVLPPSDRTLWWLGLGPWDRSKEGRKQAIDLSDQNPYLIEKRHPLVEGMLLGGVYWGGVQNVDLKLSPIISAGEHILLGQLQGTQTTGYFLNIDLKRTNLPSSPDLPIFISNLIEMRRRELPGLRRWNYRFLEDIRFRLPEESVETEEENLTLKLTHLDALNSDADSSGSSRELARTTIVELPPLERTGLYEIQDGEQSLGRFSVNFFDTEESNLLSLHTGHHESAEMTSESAFQFDQTYSWIVLLILLIMVMVILYNWFILRAKPHDILN